MVEVTRGTLLQQSENTVIGQVQETRKRSSLERMFDVANKFAFEQHRNERMATAALEGLQAAAAGETLSNIRANTPLSDTVMNIDARAKQAQAYYSSVKAKEVTNTVWQENAYELAKMPPEKATELVYQLTLEKAKTVSGGDGETLNSIMTAATPDISQMYGRQASAYANHVRNEYNTNQQAQIAQTMRALTVAKDDLKNNPNDPAAITAYQKAAQDVSLSLIPDQSITSEDWKGNLGNVFQHFAQHAGSTNQDGSYNGMDEFNVFMQSPTFKGLTLDEKDRFQKMRMAAERQIVNNLPTEFRDAETRLRAQAKEAGKESAGEYAKRLDAFNSLVKRELGLQHEAPFNQNNIEALALEKQGALRSEQQRIEDFQRQQRLANARAMADSQGAFAALQHTMDNAIAYRASGILTASQIQKQAEGAGFAMNAVDPTLPTFNATLKLTGAANDTPTVVKEQIQALFERITDPNTPAQDVENLLIRADSIRKAHEDAWGSAMTARAWGSNYGRLLGVEPLIKDGNVTRAVMMVRNEQSARSKEGNRNWEAMVEDKAKSRIADFLGFSRAPFGKQVLEDNRDIIQSSAEAIHRQYNLPHTEAGVKRSYDIALENFGELRGNPNGMVNGVRLFTDSVAQFQAKQQSYEKKTGKKQMPMSTDSIQETLSTYSDRVFYRGFDGSEPMVKGRKQSSRMVSPQRNINGDITYMVEDQLDDGTWKTITVTQDQLLEFVNTENVFEDGSQTDKAATNKVLDEVYQNSLWGSQKQTRK